MRCAPGRAADDVGSLARRGGVAGHVIEAAGFELGDGLQTGEIVQIRGFGRVVGDVALLQIAHHLFEERRLIVAQLGIEPVFGPQEDLAVRLPDTIAFHPGPPVRVEIRGGDLRLEMANAALDEDLDRGERQPDARGLDGRLGAGIDEEVLEQFVERIHIRQVAWRWRSARRFVAKLLQDVGDQRVALRLPNRVVDRLDDG